MDDFIPFEEKYTINQDTIYKYTSTQTAEIVIATSTLKFTNPKEFNDPFDCDEKIIDYNINETGIDFEKDIDKLAKDYYDLNEKELIAKKISFENLKILFKKFPGTIEGYRRSKIKTLDETYVCCFSNTYKNSIMWSHYSDKHKGVCLAFNLKIGMENILTDKKLSGFGKVDYDRTTKINYLKDKVKAISKLLLSKAKDWSYEEEVRLIMLKEKGLLQFNKNFLAGIIFGCRVEDYTINEMKSLCEKHGYKGLDFVRAKKADFELEFESINF